MTKFEIIRGIKGDLPNLIRNKIRGERRKNNDF